MIHQLTIATFNPGKLVEYTDLFDSLPITLQSLDAFSGITEVDETGETFDENARLKAIGYARQTGTVVLADDSGLEVDAIGGRPGVYSARYGGPNLTFAERTTLVLDEMQASGSRDRGARFVCEIVVASPEGEILVSATGICVGRIAEKAVGSGGFGYDPIFIPDGYDKSFGELSAAVKHQISHRGQAFPQIIPFLRDNKAV